MKKKILIISPAFAPFSGVGAKRMNSLAKYLTLNSEYSITILKNSSSYWPVEMLTDHRIENINTIDIEATTSKSFRKMQKKYSEKLNLIVKKTHYHLIIISAGPFYTLKSIKELTLKYNTKIVLEYRDLWLLNPKRPEKYSNRIKVKIKNAVNFYRKIERSSVKYASCLVVTSIVDKNIIERKYRNTAEKIRVIQNGYDSDDIEQLENTKNENSFTICILGKFSYYCHERTDLFLEVVMKLSTQFSIDIMHIGSKERYVEEFFKFNTCENLKYRNLGFVPYAKSLGFCKQADLCMLIEDSPTGFGTKVYDYIRLNKPILLIAKNPGLLGSLVKSFRNGFVATKLSEIENAIKTIKLQNIEELDSSINIQEFSRDAGNEVYLQLIRTMIGEEGVMK